MLAAQSSGCGARRSIFFRSVAATVQDSARPGERNVARLRGGERLVGLILMFASGLFFWMMHLDYPFLGGVVSGALN